MSTKKTVGVIGAIGAIGALAAANIYKNKNGKGEFRKLEKDKEPEKDK